MAHQSFILGSKIKISSWKSVSYNRGKGYKLINLYSLKTLVLQKQFENPTGRNFLAT